MNKRSPALLWGIARFIDFDRDGDLDFVTSAPDPKRWVLYRNQDGRLSKDPIWESNETTDCDHIDVLDFNKDGWMDLAATHESHCTLYFNKEGRFGSKPDWETDIIANANQIDFGDFDGDGDDDSFDEGTVVYENANNPWTQRHYWHDLDRDGQPELFCAKGAWGKTGASLQLVRQEGSPTMTVRWKSPPDTMFHAFDFGDIDGDGDTDVVASDYANGGFVFLYLNENEKLAEEPAWSAKVSGPVHEAVLGDIDLDGDLDLAVGARDQAHIYENH